MSGCVALIGATGAVGGEILDVLEQQNTGLDDLRLFASERSAGGELEFRGADCVIEEVSAQALRDCDVIVCAAPNVLDSMLGDLRQTRPGLIDVSGVLELDSDVPLALPGVAEHAPWLAVPRGVVAGLIEALRPLSAELQFERITVTTLESASGAGRRGLDELQEQTVGVLSAMTGDPGVGEAFPRALAFDCLPLVGESDGAGGSLEERRLVHVLRRALQRPGLSIEATRFRVPVFTGALASVEVQLAKAPGRDQLRRLWDAAPVLRALDEPSLPSARGAVAHDAVELGRIRLSERPARLSFVLGLDTLRRGAALPVVESLRQRLAQ